MCTLNGQLVRCWCAAQLLTKRGVGVPRGGAKAANPARNNPATSSAKLSGSGYPITQDAARSARAEHGREVEINRLLQNRAESRATVLAGSVNVMVDKRSGRCATEWVAIQLPYECPTRTTSVRSSPSKRFSMHRAQ